MNPFFHFVFITGAVPSIPYFRTKYYYEDKSIQSRRLKGKAILVSNHNSLLDYVVMVYAFWPRYTRLIGSEALFKKKANAWFFKNIGIIRAERYNKDFSFLNVAKKVLENNGVVAIFPEARLPKPNEKSGLPFTHGATYLSLDTDTTMVPVYIEESKHFKVRTKFVIGLPFKASDYYDDSLSKEDNVIKITEILRTKVFKLKELIVHEKKK